jgi:hypothetical protein
LFMSVIITKPMNGRRSILFFLPLYVYTTLRLSCKITAWNTQISYFTYRQNFCLMYTYIGRYRVWILVRKTYFFLQKRSDRLWCPPNILLIEYWGSFPGVKRPGLEVNHSSPSSTDIKKEWRYTYSPFVCFHVMGRDNFTLLTSCKSGFSSVCHKYRILKKSELKPVILE